MPLPKRSGGNAGRSNDHGEEVVVSQAFDGFLDIRRNAACIAIGKSIDAACGIRCWPPSNSVGDWPDLRQK